MNSRTAFQQKRVNSARVNTIQWLNSERFDSTVLRSVGYCGWVCPVCLSVAQHLTLRMSN